MKTFYSAVFMLLMIMAGCKKDNNVDDDIMPPDTEIPAPQPGTGTEIGSPQGIINETSIGTDGGSITSSDGHVKITVPAGAVRSITKFSIQQISNYNPMAVGRAYRFEPHGINFDKPVTVTIQFEEHEIRGSTPAALGIAYQENNRVWHAIGGAVIDPGKRTVSVQTEHFSDYSLFESFYIKPGFAMVEPGKTLTYEVVSTENLLAVPLVKGKTVPLDKPKSVIASYIKKNTWKLAGPGSLEVGDAAATYKAPAQVGAQKTATISVELDLGQRREKLILVASVEIDEGGELELGFGGDNGTIRKGYRIVRLENDQYAIGHSQGYEPDGTVLLIRWKGGIGAHPWNAIASGGDPLSNTFSYAPKNSDTDFYNSFWADEEDVYDSGGEVYITDMGDNDGFVKGVFDVAPAGHGVELVRSSTIIGRFKLRKTW